MNEIYCHAVRGEIGAIRDLFAKNKDIRVDEPDEYFGNTPLMAASERGHVETVEFFIDKEANIYAQRKDGDSVLMLVLYALHDIKSPERKEPYYKIIEMLLSRDIELRYRSAPRSVPKISLLDMRSDMFTPRRLLGFADYAEIGARVLAVAEKVESKFKEAQEKAQAELREREIREEIARLELYSEKSPSLLRDRNKEEKSSHWWSFSSLFSTCGFWGKKQVEEPTPLESERENLLGRKMKVE